MKTISEYRIKHRGKGMPPMIIFDLPIDDTLDLLDVVEIEGLQFRVVRIERESSNSKIMTFSATRYQGKDE